MPKSKTSRRSSRQLVSQQLSRDEEAFVRHFQETGGDWAEAARRARFHPDDGRALMANPAVLAAIERVRRNPSTPAASAAWIKRRLLDGAVADPRELSEHWRVPCRYCWGKDHLYQWRDANEFEAAKREQEFQVSNIVAAVMGRFKFGEDAQENADAIGEELEQLVERRFGVNDGGGYEYTVNRLPCRGSGYVKFMEDHARVRGRVVRLEATHTHDCPRCDGHGVSHVIFHDTRFLSPGAASLFLGVKVTNGGGLEYKTRDPFDSLDKLARVLGLYHGVKPLETLDPTKMTRENLIAALADYAGVYAPEEVDSEVPFLESQDDVTS